MADLSTEDGTFMGQLGYDQQTCSCLAGRWLSMLHKAHAACAGTRTQSTLLFLVVDTVGLTPLEAGS